MATNKSATYIKDFLLTPYWHVTSKFNLLSLTMGTQTKSNVSSNKFVSKKILVLKPYQLQVIISRPKINAIIERVQKFVYFQQYAHIILTYHRV
jgi:hypothetical protein